MHQLEKTVLVIDDDTAIRNMLRMVLEHSGYHVVIARDGEDGLDILRAMARTPDLILLDLNMPIMTGWEFRRAQKRDNRIAHVPVVVFSADRSITEMPFAIDALSCFQKPLDFHKLLDWIEQTLGSGNLTPVG